MVDREEPWWFDSTKGRRCTACTSPKLIRVERLSRLAQTLCDFACNHCQTAANPGVTDIIH